MTTLILNVPDDLDGHVRWLLDGEETRDRVRVYEVQPPLKPDVNLDVDVRDYTAIFSIEMEHGKSEEEWAELLAYMQDHFDNQWDQTSATGQGWTVTIHKDDRIDG